MDQLRPSSIKWTDTYDQHEHGVLSDVARFRRSAFWLAEDLFRDDDLIFATSESLARVAKTIIVLVHSVNPNRNPICSELFRRLRSYEGPHKLFIPARDRSTFDRSLTPSNQSTSDRSPVPPSQLISNQPPARFNQSPQNQPTSDKWFSDKSSSDVFISNQSPPPSKPPASSLSPLSGLSPLSTCRMSLLSNQSPLCNFSPSIHQLYKESLPPTPNSSPPGYPLPPGYQSPPGYQLPLGNQSPPLYQSTTSLPAANKSSNNPFSSLSPSNRSTLNRFDIQSNFPYSSTNSSYRQLKDDIGNERGEAALDEFCMTPTVSTEMISPVQNEPPSETLTDKNALAIYLMAVDKANRFVGNNGHPNDDVSMLPSQHKQSSEDLVYPRAQRTGGRTPTESPDGFVDEFVMVPAFKDAPPRNLYSSSGGMRYEVPERIVQMETSDSLISNPIPPSLVVGQPITSPRLNSRLLDLADQTWPNERRTGSNSTFSRGSSCRSGSANGSVPAVLLPRQSRKGDLESTRQRLPPELNHVFGTALHLGHLERMANSHIASGQDKSTDLTQTLVIDVAGEARKEYVGIRFIFVVFLVAQGSLIEAAL